MTDGSKSLLGLEALSEPACKLIDAIRSGAGIMYEPRKIRRKAEADADAQIILAEAKATTAAIEQRALTRLRAQEVRRQENMESIVDQAVDSLDGSTEIGEPDRDWLVQFFDYCQDTSSEEVQAVWARTLAGEFEKPGRFSRRAMLILKHLSATEARILQQISCYVWTIDDDVGAVIWRQNNGVFGDKSIRFQYGELQALESIGLIQLEIQNGFFMNILPGKCIAQYGDESFMVASLRQREAVLASEIPTDLQSGVVMLSPVGLELVSLCEPQRSPAIRDHALNQWRNKYVIEAIEN